MVRAITFDAFGTVIDEGRDELIGIAREICKAHRPSLRPDALLATWDRYLYSGADSEPFKTLSELTQESLGKAFQDHRIVPGATQNVASTVPRGTASSSPH